MEKTNAYSKKWWIRCALAFASQLVILGLFIITDRLAYATNDDTTMVAIASGGYGTPSQYVINLHLILGYLLKHLFTIFNGVNWITVLFIGTDLLGALVLDMIVASAKKDNASFLCTAAITTMAFFIVISHFTFTVVAYWAGIAGLLGITYVAMNQIERSQKWLIGIFSGLAFAACLLIRAEVLQSLLVVYAAYIVIMLFFHKKWMPVVIAAGAVCLMSVSIKSNLWMNNMNPTQKAFLEWGETRSAALDCAAVPYNEEEFSKRGITYNQYQAIYNAFYYDFDDVDIDTMEALIELNHPLNKYDLDVMGMLKNHFSLWGNVRQLLSFTSYYRILFAAVLLFYLIFGKEEKHFFLFLVWGSVLAAECIFGFIQRPLYRVIMPNYLMGSILIIINCCVDPVKVQKLCLLNISLQKITVTLTMLAVCGCVCTYTVWSMLSSKPYSDRERHVVSYMAENDDKVFLAGDAGVFGIDVASSVWDHPGKRGIWNLIGNWETYSVPYLELMKKQGIQNPYDVLFEAIDNDKILLLTRLGDDFPSFYPWILDLVEENYGVKVNFEKVEDASQTETQGWPDGWAVYKLVTREV